MYIYIIYIICVYKYIYKYIHVYINITTLIIHNIIKYLYIDTRGTPFWCIGYNSGVQCTINESYTQFFHVLLLGVLKCIFFMYLGTINDSNYSMHGHTCADLDDDGKIHLSIHADGTHKTLHIEGFSLSHVSLLSSLSWLLMRSHDTSMYLVCTLTIMWQNVHFQFNQEPCVILSSTSTIHDLFSHI